LEGVVRVLMVDDHVMFLQGLKNLLTVLAPTVAADIANSLPLALQLLRSATYDLVLLDWHLPDTDSTTTIRQFRDSGCMGRIVILSGETSSASVAEAIELGAAGYIPKLFSSEQMVSALDQVLAGQVFLPPSANPGPAASRGSQRLEADPRFAALTARQIETYQAAVRGLSNKLIARELGIAESTVKSHLSVVYAVLGVRNRTEAAFQASRDGIRIA
jgi:DNA-binding NarL/FixJ family response regulator